MATYRHSGRHSVDKAQDPTITTNHAKYMQDEEKACPPAVVEVHSSETFIRPPESAKDLITEVIHAEDDPSLNPWTFRMWFIGIGLSTFGGTLATIYYFKPQAVVVSTVFLAVAAIVVMGSAAANAPLAIEVLAVSKLYYGLVLNAAVGIFMVWSSQCLGYGFAGLLRRTLVYPTKMLFPSNLPMNSLLEALHGDKIEVGKKLRVFYIGFLVLFFYEIIPEWIMPVLIGVSVVCLAKRDSLLITNLFGGSNGNEGLGLFNLSFDWQYIANPSPLWYPLQTLFNNFIGYVLCVAVFVGVYYGNIWNSKSFPFLSQSLYTDQSNGTNFTSFNQTAVLDKDYKVDLAKVAEQGIPYFTGSFAIYILATNLSITSTFSHLMLWNFDDLKSAWGFASVANLKFLANPQNWDLRFWKADTTKSKWGGPDDKETDPHYRLMLAYDDAPNWWYGTILVLSTVVGLVMLYLGKSTLPWWGFAVSCGLSFICVLFFGAQYAITGYNYNIQPVIQMLGGYLHPGRPLANMYFVLFGYNSVVQGQLLLRDLKFAQYAHLSPRCTFTVQLVSITTNQRETLLDIKGTSVWSGQLQSFNSQAIMWGGLANQLFTAGKRYQWLTFSFLIGFALPVPFWIGHKVFPRLRLDYLNTALIASFIGLLNVGINSVTMPWFIIGAFSQGYLRKKRPNWFIKYNYILSAAMDGGTQVLVFILSFAVFGGSGTQHNFPPYWGNNYNSGMYDYCMAPPGGESGE
ncbi:OPT superfamily oligopeptide transporter [Venturia nashicola]|uniref:OPT superfamily oligopeptide transporter n=1 Tax=Venturia nashicola TaxID=86259 RepID=A0A4Z1NT63_9PEZI|nr:OPT superfamily oligopeptide transporter [Venturia nashicola]